ncbi:MFS transporter [Aquamicrobium sp. LC103]|uniref:MFS transporter n=1 Tax=Aquamicrobium sp. LC103 TaxID=1120658 RepID=UPI00063E9B51|nr:MFS transporter [Aquamicrobium sp. LC103]TKT75214.1 MFS transporter [Aquamicrobium sp. LC103]
MDRSFATATELPEATRRTFCPPASRKYVLLTAILASSMGFIDGSVVSLAMPAIRSDLGATLVEAQWINNSYMLFLGALVLIGGAAGDVFGIRNIFAAGIAVFVVMSLACAVAPDSQSLIVMRALQGVGAAFMVPSSLAIIAKSYPAETRGKAIGIWAASSSLTTAFGPFIGGMVLSFGDAWMWRLIFAINGPIGLVALGLIYLRIPSDRPTGIRRLDIPGALLATLGLGSLAWGLTAFGQPAEQRVLTPVVWLAVGVATAVAFVWWERRARAPMVKLDLFRSWAFSGANLYTLALFLAFSAVLFFLPMTLVSAWSASEWQVSLMLLPLSLAIGLLSGLAGRFADRHGPRMILTAGAALVGLSFTLLALTIPLMDMWRVTFPVLAVMGLGMGLLVSPLSTAVMLAAPDSDAGLASGINNAVARVAGLLAVAALGAVAGIVFDRVFADAAPGIEFGVTLRNGLTPSVGMLRIQATNIAFQVIAAVSAAMCFLAAAIAWFTQPSWEKPEKAE